MPTPPAEEPLRKITLNIFEKDYEWYKRNYGPGWQSQLRELIRDWKNIVEARR